MTGQSTESLLSGMPADKTLTNDDERFNLKKARISGAPSQIFQCGRKILVIISLFHEGKFTMIFTYIITPIRGILRLEHPG